MNILLQGVVGSTAYGLAGPESDVDRLGIYAAPTSEFHGLKLPVDKRASKVTTNPDKTLHEVRKYALLALNGNPTITELMWLPRDTYDIRHSLGDELINIRKSFLSARRVKDAYLGYATQQFKDLERRGDGSFSSDTRKRTAKHARHLLRLCHQGWMLYSTGELIIRVTNPQDFHEFGERVANGDIDHARKMMTEYERLFMMPSVLPDDPDVTVVENWLHRVRREFL